MPYQFTRKTATDAEAKRLIREQLDKALYQLTESLDDHPAEAVHEARKSFKKSRSVLRLVRKAIDESVYQRENDCLRQAGRLLAPARDAQARLETLDSLMEHYATAIDLDLFQELRAGMDDYQRQMAVQVLEKDDLVSTVLPQLKDMRLRLDDWHLQASGWDALAPGWKRLYRQGRERMATAYQQETAEAFHQWRKRVKDLRYDLRLLRPLWPELFKGLGQEVHTLSDWLGDEHDLTVLRAFLQHHHLNGLVGDSLMKVLMPLIDHRQGRLRREAYGLGQRVYAEKPKAFIQRMGHYWDAWHPEAHRPDPANLT